MDKRQQQLGMNPSTAAHRLRVNLLFDFAIRLGYSCFHCGGPLQREGFSIEHKTPWLDSVNPKEKFFDIKNIGFSHLSCNCSAGGKGAARLYSPEVAAERIKESKKRHWTPERRRKHYERTGN